MAWKKLMLAEEHPQKIGRMKGTNPVVWFIGDYTYTKAQLTSLYEAIGTELMDDDPSFQTHITRIAYQQKKARGE